MKNVATIVKENICSQHVQTVSFGSNSCLNCSGLLYVSTVHII